MGSGRIQQSTGLWEGDAALSEDTWFRYRLRRWRLDVPKPEHEPYVLFVGLNPSTADASTDDNTVRAWKRLAIAWGYRKFCVGNVYAYRSRDPKKLWQAADPIGPSNQIALADMAIGAQLIVACWGAHAKRADAEPIADLLAQYGTVWCLGMNANGTPKHPLFLPTDVERILFAPQRRAA